MMETQWRVYQRETNDLLQHLCNIRGLNSQHLGPDFTSDLHDPFLLAGMEKAVELVTQAQKNRWEVAVFGDYDADGTPASVVLALMLTQLGIAHQVILPTRAEGYGLTVEAVKKLPTSVKLLITVDTGITAVSEIALAKEQGMMVIVLDHHLPKEALPFADALIDPFLPESNYPFTGLCGCALAWKLVVALAKNFPEQLNEGFIKWLLDLVAVSTVADMMPIVGENRTLVHYGLAVLQKNRRPGIKAMLELAGLQAENLSSGSLGYAIGPRLNASGRLKDNRPAFELLMAGSYEDALPIALAIEQANKERQELVEKVLAEAEATLFQQNSSDDHCFLLLGENWPSGILGLVAGKLTGKYFRPVVVTSSSGTVIGGSARSTGNYSIIDGLNSQAELLDRYGGHNQAAGLALQKTNWSKFVDGIKRHTKEHIASEDLVAKYIADAVLEPSEVSLEVAQLCQQLSPFGAQNAQPLFIIKDVTLGTARTLGVNGKHLKWQAKVGQTAFEAIGFGFGKRPIDLSQAHLLGYLEVNTWQGRKSLQMRLVDLAPISRDIRVENG